jgi:hypothetical protein
VHAHGPPVQPAAENNVRWTRDGTGVKKIRLVVLAGTLALAACNSQPESSVVPDLETLIDCTADEISRRRGTPLAASRAAALTESQRAAVLALATDWAMANCYLPCEFQMCGALIALEPELVGVYVRPSEPLEGGIYPEAGIEVDLASMTIVRSELLHTGCQYWTGTCTPEEMRKRSAKGS